MVRRTKEEAAETRERLLDAAERVFRERGVARTSLAEIASAAGMTRGALYWHFRDKSDVFDAMCARATSPLQAFAERVGGGGASALATVRELCVHALAHLATEPRAQAFFEIVFHKTERVGDMEQFACRREHEKSAGARRRIDSALRRAVAQRELAPDTDTALAAHLLHGAVVGLMYEWVREPSAYDLARAAPALVDSLIAGLRADPPRKARAARRVKGASKSGAAR
jgi:TetR/AcrR family acrAB operon transcriptional repressor